MGDPNSLTEVETKALREQATIDVVTVVCTTMEMMGAGHDITSWVAEQTANWTGTHGRQAALIIGMLATGAELGPDDVALMGKLLMDN